MKILFDWCDSFDDASEWRGDEDILSLEITQREGSFAFAKVSMRNKNVAHRYARIGAENNGVTELIFRGKVTAFPLNFGDFAITQIELLSEPDDYQEQLRNFSREHRSQVPNFEDESAEASFDDLFFSESEKDNPTIFLEGDSKIFYWDMKTGKLSLSDINIGKNNFEICKNDTFANTTRIRFAREPYGRVNLRISASWVQKVYGFVDLIPIIARCFNRNRINTFTDISSSFKNTANNGYSVCYHNISKVNPNGLGVLDAFPLFSAPIKITNHGEEKFMRFRRFYYEGNFVLNWEYHQKRVENVVLSLVDKKYKREKNLFIKLNAIQLSKNHPYWRAHKNYNVCDKVIHEGFVFECEIAHNSGLNFDARCWKQSEKVPDALGDDTLSSFFATSRGKFCVRYAMRKAAALINYSRRYVVITLILDANKFFNITVNDQITLKDFDEHFRCGKVIETKLCMTGEFRFMKVAIGCAPDTATNIWDQVKNYRFEIGQDEHRVEMADIVKDVSVENSPEEQEKLLQSENFETVSAAKNFLKKHATKIKTTLHPLSTKREISRKIELEDLEV